MLMLRAWLARRRARHLDWTLRNLGFVRHRDCGKFLVPNPNDADIQDLLRADLARFNEAICLCERGRFVADTR